MNLPTSLLAAALLAAAPALTAHASRLAGTATVVDGDTVRIGNTSIRLHGIDAPESDQLCTHDDGRRWRCGQQAALALDAFIDRRPLQCDERSVDRYNRVVADCYVGPTSINRWMVRNGWAIAYRVYSKAYVPDEELAAADRLNIWSGTFDEPVEHRRNTQARHPTARPTPNTAPTSGCTLKGNISASGERIFHAPGQRDYAKVVIDESAGERWFCSSTEAIQAGWRRAQR